MTDLNRSIRILRLSRYGTVGSIVSNLDYGTRATLVECGRAEWVDTPKEQIREQRKQKSLEKVN